MDTANLRAAQARDDDHDGEHVQPATLPSRFVKIPTTMLGKILDYERRTNAVGDVVTFGHASANAIHALAIKLAVPHHVLNKHNLRKYGFGWRRFAEAIRVLKERGVLERKQRGRGYATERVVGTHHSERFVALDKALLKGRSTLVAFVATVNLSPTPQRPEDVAGRFGITSATTIRDLVRDATNGGYIVHHQETVTGKILVARRGYKFGDTISDSIAKNGVAENSIAKNGPHNEMGETSEQKEKQKESYNIPSLRDGEPARVESGDEMAFLTKQQIRPLPPERIILADWRTAKFFRGQLPVEPTTKKAPLSQRWLHNFGR